MEFRQVAHSLCRTAAAATRPSLASARQAPSTILLQQCRFTTNSKKELEAAVATPAQQQQQPPPFAQSPLYRMAQVQASTREGASGTAPPRPPFVPKPNVLDQSKTNKTRSWAAAQSHPSRGTTLTGRAPTGTSPSQDLFSQITSDMEQATSGLANWNADEFLSRNYGPAEPEMRLRPSTGRTVQLKNNVDLARGFALLGKLVSRNRMRADFMRQRFHERPALKRKREKRERWQRRFKQGFRGCLERVYELKAQGW